MRKVASADNRSIFYRACAKFVTRFASKINRHGLSSNGASFAGIKKIATTLICYARLTQCSKPVKHRKNPFFYLFRPDFWTDLNGCRQRLLFTRQLTQQKCSLCSQGTYIGVRGRGSNPIIFYSKLDWPITREGGGGGGGGGLIRDSLRYLSCLEVSRKITYVV